MDKLVYTVKDVSEIIHTNQSYVYALIKSGLLPALKLGSYKIRKETLVDFLQKYEGYDLTNPLKIKYDKYSKYEVGGQEIVAHHLPTASKLK